MINGVFIGLKIRLSYFSKLESIEVVHHFLSGSGGSVDHLLMSSCHLLIGINSVNHEKLVSRSPSSSVGSSKRVLEHAVTGRVAGEGVICELVSRSPASSIGSNKRVFEHAVTGRVTGERVVCVISGRSPSTSIRPN